MGGRAEEEAEAEAADEEADSGLAGDRTEGEEGRDEVDSCDGREEREALEEGCAADGPGGLPMPFAAALALSFLLLPDLLLCCCCAPLSASRAVPASFRAALTAWCRTSARHSSQ